MPFQVGERWHQYDALSVRDSSAGEPADSAVEKIIVLIELHDVIAGGGVRHHSIPGLTFTHAARFVAKLRGHLQLSPIEGRAFWRSAAHPARQQNAHTRARSSG